MKKILMIVLVASVLTGCGKSENEVPNKRTPEQQKAANDFYHMDGPTDRKKSKGY